MRKHRATGTGRGGHNRLRPYESLYRLLVRVAKRKHRTVMSFESFRTFTRIPWCTYCGDSVTWVLYKPWGAAYNLDRRDNSKGYTKSNCVVCCGTCNIMKGRQTVDEFYARIERIFDRREQ